MPRDLGWKENERKFPPRSRKTLKDFERREYIYFILRDNFYTIFASRDDPYLSNN